MEKIIKLENVSLAKQGRTILKDLNWQEKRENIGPSSVSTVQESLLSLRLPWLSIEDSGQRNGSGYGIGAATFLSCELRLE